MNRLKVLKILVGWAVCTAACPLNAQYETIGAPQTVVYKVIQGCQIKLDVYRTGERANRPAVMRIHGGALMGGSRKQFSGSLFSGLLGLGYVIVSVDYRLAPETKVPGVIEDLQDAYRWMRKQGSDQFGIDPGRISVMGESAGGYLTLMTGFSLEPRPLALVSYYGYGDIDGPWLSQPSEFYRKQPLVPKEEALKGVGQAVISEPRNRGPFYLYCRQQGIWPLEVSGHDPHKEPKWFDPYCPIRNVTKAYPPTLLIHGTEDTDVPYEQSKKMAAKLAEVGVEHELMTVTGAGHGFGGATPEERKHITERSVEWIKSHMK
jgi:acetyl esterase/lipase